MSKIIEAERKVEDLRDEKQQQKNWFQNPISDVAFFFIFVKNLF